MLNPSFIGDLASSALQSVNPALGGGDQLWAVNARRLESGVALARAARDGKAPMAASRRGEPYGNGTYVRRVGSIAVVPVYGPLMARMHWGYWSYDEIIRDVRMVADDDSITAILIDDDSPGGMVANVEAAAAEIARAATIKPVAAHIGGLGASAAYWLAASAGEIVAAETSLVGSVGCLIRYMDIEGIFTKLGAKVVEVVAEQSPNKRLDPDSEAGRAELQAIADDGAEMFLAGLEQSRNVSREELLSQYGQGLVFTAREALSRGMIDGIGSFEETLAALAEREQMHEVADTAAAQASMETVMATPKTEQQANPPAEKPVTIESLRADHGDLIASIEANAANAAAEAERTRILGIEKQSMPGCEDLIASLKADGKTTPAEAAVQVLDKVKTDGGAAQAVLEKMDKAAEGVVSTPSGSTADAGGTPVVASTPEQWEQEWAASDKLKAEYPTAAAYVATKKREA